MSQQGVELNLGDSTIQVTTASNGEVIVDALTWKEVLAHVERPAFFNSELKFPAQDLKKGDRVEIIMNPLPIFDVVGLVTDKSNNQPLGDVAVEWINKKTGEKKNYTTSSAGEFHELLTQNVWTDT